MATGKDTLWEKFLSPVVRLLINEEELREFSRSIDWETESDRFRRADLTYPDYYASQNFHGIQGGYLNPSAPVSYDPVTQYVLPPNETWVRQGLIDAIKVQPRRILDLGCGTGTMTLMLKQAFPNAEVIGLDLSPYMLVMSDYKATQAGLNIHWRHGQAEATGYPDASFDLVTASLLFHETPPEVTQAILREAFRLLSAGGQMLVLDGNQNTLRQTNWLMDIFEEPYIRLFAEGNLDAWMGAAGFEAVRTQEVWWVQQVTSGIKPIRAEEGNARAREMSVAQPEYANSGGIAAPAFGTSA
ncbi:class I SAM-dependent methyltransferase [Desertifilum sp. FACHB-1129]|uniref:Methyltransferase type 11 n=1 Tax=Desertifilum tharense IPPAS B-1220 TaxID=1781255 RepID=A0A1E5QRQ6_9CYAN|nr:MULTISPECIES: class I SAM-dependent methyltransferase [Desertifilum]MBD2312303.1 class I SAM-dependent methyltransferase [Desertifilum sp. FACHB-1129]MBD2323630.1 class I SAM-dependent methyltransferase [Desertifilum sp. FACHB-866]MBD2332327.1 class I SAM-dependent methyltransferase [Desertifilum sp. FACHB-868]OEJ77023.1 methyltransferase type 11 [Desertifilum tharense IPPAS B-1220]